MNISAYRLSKDTLIPQTCISQIIKGKRRLTADTALRLSHYFGNSAKFWLGLQDDYDLEEGKNQINDELKRIKLSSGNAAQQWLYVILKMKTNWKYISLFLILAIGISAPIHLGYIDKAYKTFSNDWIIKDWVYLIAGFGPFVAGLITLLLQKSIYSRITFWGNEKLKNILIVLLPVFSFSIIGLENSNDINIHYYGFIFASSILFMHFLKNLAGEDIYKMLWKELIRIGNTF